MNPTIQNKIPPKILIGVSAFVVILILVFSILTLSKKDSSFPDNSQGAINLTPLPTVAYTPPPNTVYTTVDSVNFYPSKINDFTIDRDKVEKTSRQVYENLDDKGLRDQINSDVFSWLALNEYYSQADPKKVSATYSSRNIDNMAPIKKELQLMQSQYSPTIMKMDGFYMKIRFRGTLKSQLDKLHKTEGELQPLARQLMQGFHDEAVKNPTTVLDKFNRNNTILLLNNRETSKSFNNRALFPPLMADENYTSMIKSLPVGEVSDIITLQSKLGGKDFAEDYGYAVFYITKKSGTNLPINALANEYVAKAVIQ